MTLSRRALLRGAGGAAIALPFLEEMLARDALAQTMVPQRLVTLFFGLGIYPEHQTSFDGPLEPYTPFSDRLAFLSVNAKQGRASKAHCNTGAVIFTGEAQPLKGDGKADADRAGGPSIDQLLHARYGGNTKSLSSGIWFREGACEGQKYRVFRSDGSPLIPIKRPSAVFDDLFKPLVDQPPAAPDDPGRLAEERQNRIKRSILDSVLEQYQHFRGQNSPLGAASKIKMEQHLDAIREVERELAPLDEVIDDGNIQDPSTCDLPASVQDPSIEIDYDRTDTGTGESGKAPSVSWRNFQRVYRLHADLWTLALRCDIVRFGNLMFESAGGHTNLGDTEVYRALGDSTDFETGKDSQHNAFIHNNKEGGRFAKLYQHFAQSNLAYFLGRLDESDFLDANGKTLFDNTCLVIGTEYGKNHTKEQVFHAVAGRPDLFNSGFHTDRGLNCADVYEVVAQGFGIDRTIGSGVSDRGDATFLLR
ncbi:MAG: DUF1552 domain-containing protein [Myxococcota bacterium]